MMKNIIFAALALVLFSACGTKKQYFEPDKIEDKLSYDSRLKSQINSSSDEFAVLNNGQILSKQGLIENFKLEKEFSILKYEADEFVIADNFGLLKIVNADGDELYSHKFDAAVLSVALQGDDLALILANNSIVLANRSLGIKFQQLLAPAPAQDMRVASPVFLTNMIIFPSLDGKLNVFDTQTQKIIRSFIISRDEFFNNIIYLEIKDNKMIVASSNRVVVVDEGRTFSLGEEIRNIAVYKDNIFIFAKNGNIIKTDLHLNKLFEKKFKFAIYNEINIFKDHLYVFEKTGYLIKSDLNLQEFKIYRVSGAKDSNAFMQDDKFYYSNKILNLI